MKKYIVSIFAIVISLQLKAQNDWDGIAIPVTLENGDTWVLQENVSDNFNYNAPAASKGNTFFSKWDDWYHNSWEGPASTTWSRTHSSVDGSEMILTASRYLSNRVNAGAIHSQNLVQFPLYVEARIKIMNSVLANGAWMLSPDDTQEIDYMEGYGATWSESANADISWFAERMHMSHHVFIRQPFQDWQPSEFASNTGNPSPHPTWITRNDGNGNIKWKDDYHIYGVYWKDPWHLYYFIDGVQVTKREGKDQIDPVFYTNAVNPGDSTNDTRTGLNKAMYLLFTVEEQGWRAEGNSAVIPTDNELANTENHKYKIDWIRAYKPQSSLSIKENVNDFKVDILPNPVNDKLKIDASKLIRNIDLFDVKGRKVITKSFDDASLLINLSNLSSGVYFLKILAKDGTYLRKKIIKN